MESSFTIVSTNYGFTKLKNVCGKHIVPGQNIWHVYNLMKFNKTVIPFALVG